MTADVAVLGVAVLMSVWAARVALAPASKAVHLAPFGCDRG